MADTILKNNDELGCWMFYTQLTRKATPRPEWQGKEEDNKHTVDLKTGCGFQADSKLELSCDFEFFMPIREASKLIESWSFPVLLLRPVGVASKLTSRRVSPVMSCCSDQWAWLQSCLTAGVALWYQVVQGSRTGFKLTDKWISPVISCCSGQWVWLPIQLRAGVALWCPVDQVCGSCFPAHKQMDIPSNIWLLRSVDVASRPTESWSAMFSCPGLWEWLPSSLTDGYSL